MSCYKRVLFAQSIRILLTLALTAGIAASVERESRAMAAEAPDKTEPFPAPRDPDAAVREEYALALEADTVAALELFITRHADHPLAKEAQMELERLRANSPLK